MNLLRDTGRPAGFNMVFWTVFALTVAYRLLFLEDLATGVRFAAVMAVVAVLWLMLPWDSTASRRRKLIAPCYLAAATCIGMVSERTHGPLVLLGVASFVFLHGMRTGIMAVIVYLLGLLLSMLLLGTPWEWAVAESLFMVIFSTLVLGMAWATLDARRKGEETRLLLQRVRELTVAEERARMARDMHDSIGHQLTVVKMGLENAERFRERRPSQAWAEVRQAKEMTARALADARLWARALRPLDLDGHLGAAALDRLARSFDGTGVQVGFQVTGPERRLDPDTELTLYRVLQEALTNALRHARARHVRARLSFGDERVVLTITDDGEGADDITGFGLSSLAERVHGIGGRFSAGNAEGGGFTVRAEVPVSAS